MKLSDRECFLLWFFLRTKDWGGGEETIAAHLQLFEAIDSPVYKRAFIKSGIDLSRLSDKPSERNIGATPGELVKALLARGEQPFQFGLVAARCLRRLKGPSGE